MSRTFVYVACASGGTVDVLALDPETGALEAGSRTGGLDHVSSLALDPAGTLYAACNVDRPFPDVPPRVVALSLAQRTGAASAGPSRELPVTTCYVSLSPDGRALFGASYHEGRLIRFPAPGVAGTVATFDSGANTHCAVVSPDGAFVYTASLGDDRVSWFRIDASGLAPARAAGADDDGAVAPSGHVATASGSGPRHLRFDASGERAYVLHELSGDVAVYERDTATGRLALLQRASAIEGLELAPGPVRSPTSADPGLGVVWCSDLRITPDGRYLVAAERSTSTLATFAIRDGGLLEFLRRTPTEAQPRGMAIDPSGKYLLACGERSDHITAYRIGADGSLAAASRAATAGGPLWIECWATA
ncbi:beta-propeller fold lactonase family protein [Sinomonas sp. JGH33]|uniref:Beta-propeller fold lactonase family protein n=1 Tax=Sinomonas terricola TaxID=3110330 RepID=A0ABU5T1Z4_9MICC|nr:beta-propeller fold lactonase family protein [Sinomonas sp. JGH33]MEA5453682.1 beta-propeller fold lactonase family protein [Sinomonas sp. JGH33]